MLGGWPSIASAVTETPLGIYKTSPPMPIPPPNPSVPSWGVDLASYVR